MAQGTRENVPLNERRFFFNSFDEAQDFIYDLNAPQHRAIANSIITLHEGNNETENTYKSRYVIVPRLGGESNYYKYVATYMQFEDMIELEHEFPMVVTDNRLVLSDETYEPEYQQFEVLEGIPNPAAPNNGRGGKHKTHKKRRTHKRKTNKRRTNRKRYSRKH